MYANKFCDAGQVPIFRYFEAWHNIFSNIWYFKGVKRRYYGVKGLSGICSLYEYRFVLL